MIKKLEEKIYDYNGVIFQDKLNEILKGRRQVISFINLAFFVVVNIYPHNFSFS